ncbi:outer membrane beta-barrel family protein [Pontibacter anaerobius]|uniref:Outer membrane beta-barrel family protein n=1 Tax=Pontibacter anaerobius TaxID=2993940 RepID=A0ABT3RK26_9BACT|nr:outer membrane beta-barrel family protein [Pontibacter anaerobius]MCX2741801.1 outer membrane beta-barrel family protein [Pontibacter anaerobius]
MKSLLLTSIMLLLLSLTVQAQQSGTLTGKVLDEQGQPLGFVNVAVLKAADNAVVTGTIADMEGGFVIQSPVAGKYKLKLTMLGYRTTETEAFEINASGSGKDFGRLTLQEDAQLLGEVTIQAMRPTVVALADKTVVTVENTALAGGSTAFEVLAKSPGVWVDQDGNIKLNGKAGVQVMLNGKLSYLGGKELQNMMQSMSAENIKDLEIISNPAAKYDAEGASGIININLKKNETAGLNGSVHGGYQYNELHGYTAGADINYKQNALSSFASLDVAERTRFRLNEMQRTFSGQESSRLNQHIREEARRFTPSLRIGADYDLDNRHSVGVLGDLSLYSTDDRIVTKANLQDGKPANDVLVDALNMATSANANSTLNLHYLGKLDTVGTLLSADLDYVRLNSDNDATFQNRLDSLGNNSPLLEERLLTENPTSYDIYSGKVDFAKQLGKAGKLELGAKASHVKSDNELRFYKDSDGRKVIDTGRSNHFTYKENIYAAYASFSTQLGKFLRVKGGLRAEQTVAEGNSVTLDQKTDRTYLNLFPSLFIQHNVSENYQVSYSFSRRINRPRYDALNPFIFYIDPYSWVTGNPYLKPQYTNSFSVTQVLKQNYNLVLGYAVTKDFIAEIPMQNSADKTTVFQQQNVEDLKSFHATLVAPVQVSGRWQINNNATLAYQGFIKELNDQSLENQQLSFSAQSNHNIQLPKDVRLELNAAYQGPMAYGLYHIKANWGVDAGLKRSFMEDRLDLSLSVTDIFKTRRVEGGTNINGNTITSSQYTGSQSFRVNLRYRFSKGAEFRASKRNVDLEEVNRAGGN